MYNTHEWTQKKTRLGDKTNVLKLIDDYDDLLCSTRVARNPRHFMIVGAIEGNRTRPVFASGQKKNRLSLQELMINLQLKNWAN